MILEENTKNNDNKDQSEMEQVEALNDSNNPEANELQEKPIIEALSAESNLQGNDTELDENKNLRSAFGDYVINSYIKLKKKEQMYYKTWKKFMYFINYY